LLLGVSKEEIENELRAVNKLCKSAHPNIVQVFGVGPLLRDSVVYFIDMELCDLSLERYCHGENVPGLPNWNILRDQGPFQFGRGIWDILEQIVEGLKFIHKKREVHRDLCPGNGGLPRPSVLICSSVFRKR